MAFLIVVPSITARCKRVFGIIAVWAHPHQACFHTLEEAARKFVLLVDESMDWSYAFIWLNNAISHVLLFSEGCISAMMGSMPSTDVCGWFHQMQICKLLQHEDLVVYPEGLNKELEALQFTFQVPPHWHSTTPSKPTHRPQLIEVNFGRSVQPESATTVIQTLPSTPASPLPYRHHQASQ